MSHYNPIHTTHIFSTHIINPFHAYSHLHESKLLLLFVVVTHNFHCWKSINVNFQISELTEEVPFKWLGYVTIIFEAEDVFKQNILILAFKLWRSITDGWVTFLWCEGTDVSTTVHEMLWVDQVYGIPWVRNRTRNTQLVRHPMVYSIPPLVPIFNSLFVRYVKMLAPIRTRARTYTLSPNYVPYRHVFNSDRDRKQPHDRKRQRVY
jgi:hypothetical protein